MNSSKLAETLRSIRAGNNSKRAIVNLSRSYMGGVDLSSANLTRANMSRTYLTGANLTGANLTGANLTRAYLPRANLTGANLTGVVTGYKTNWANKLFFEGACQPALNWAEEQGELELAELVARCPQANWIEWLVLRGFWSAT